MSESLIASIRAKSKEREEHAGRLSVDDLKQMQRVQAFEQIVRNVVEQESKYEAAHGGVEVKKEPKSIGLANGHVSESKADAASRNGSVLTLFGNAPTPKQLFSSMQNTPAAQSEKIIKTELPVEEMSLPNGLTATNIMPLPSDESKKGPTFEDAFAPAYNLPALHPPKAHKRSSTRDSTVTWEFKDHVSRSSKKGGYTTQSLTVGDWISYGGGTTSGDPASPGARRKQRDRALSGESSQPPSSKETLEEALIKEEEALFRRAYSSFAPSHDNTKAIVPEETKSMVWWQKIGDKKYEETFAIDPALLDEKSGSLADGIPAPRESDVEEDFSKVVEEMEDVPDEMPAEPARDKTAVDSVLQEISELLETLASHQRIRNATLPSSTAVSRTPISPAPVLTSRIGRPGSPAEDELSTYHSIRRELAYLILKLPPYAVAKLDGNQLSELGVSRSIPFEGKDTKGTMEEDQVARLAKYTAMATAASISNLTRPGSNSGPHYSSTNQRTPAIGQAANTRYGQSAQYGASRTPAAPAYSRSSSSQSTYGTPSATAPRPGYGQQPNQYSRPAQPQHSYSQSNGSQLYRQTPGGYAGGSFNQSYNKSTQPSQRPPGTYSSQPLAQYQQRAAQNATAYQMNSNQPQRTASPSLKPAPPRPGAAPIQQTGGSSGRATPVNYPSQPQTPVNGRLVAPRPASTTPQPIALAPPSVQGAQETKMNGHAS